MTSSTTSSLSTITNTSTPIVILSWLNIRTECSILLDLASPVILAYLLNYSLLLTSQVIVGRLGASALAAASLATVWANATGHAIAIGSSSACDTLSSQAFGAGNIPRIGHILQRAVAIMASLCILILLAWIFAEHALLILGQDPTVASMAGTYVQLLMLGFPAISIYEVLKRSLLSMNITLPQVFICAIAVPINACLGLFFMYCTPLGFLGPPLALSISQIFMLCMMISYLRWHRSINKIAFTLKQRWLRLVGHDVDNTSTTTNKSLPIIESTKTFAPPGIQNNEADKQHLSMDANEGTIDNTLVNTNTVVSTENTMQQESIVSTTLNSTEETNLPTIVEVKKETIITPSSTATISTTRVSTSTNVDDILDLALSDKFSLSIALSGWWEYLSLGLPSAALLLTEWGSFECAAIIAGIISTESLAAHTVIASTAALSFMPCLGLSVATGIRIGQLCGENEPARARLAFSSVLILDIIYAFMNLVIVIGVSGVWGRLFTDDLVVVEIVAQYMWILGIYSVFDSLQCICAGALRGLGLPVWGTIINVIGWFAVALPLAWVFSIELVWELAGIWIAFTIGVFVVFSLMMMVLLTRNWTKIAESARNRALQGKAVE
jgi:Na+-driven multidrug efflux pump